MEKDNFEDKWKEAFRGAEAQPSEGVWSAVESRVIAAENQTMKRQVVFYQRLAAAAILFALLVGAFGTYFWRNQVDNLATKPIQTPAVKEDITKNREESIKQSNAEQRNINSEAVVKPEVEKLVQVERMTVQRTMKSKVPPSVVPVSNDTAIVGDQSIQTAVEFAISRDNLSTKDSTSRETLVTSQQESPILIQKKKEESIEIPGLNQPVVKEELKSETKTKKKREVLWAALGLSAGSYDPGSVSSSHSTTAPNYGPQASTAGSSTRGFSMGTSYSVGLSLGKRIAGRWVLQGGVNYLNQTAGYGSNIVSTSATTNQAVAYDLFNADSKASAAVTYTAPYQINSTLEFISIPVQAGYLLVDRKVGLQMNAGIATDFFVRNSLQDQSGQASKYSQTSGSDSPYRSVNWAGLVSTELSYKMGRQYRLSLVPGVRYLFGSSLKSGATSNSYVADIGFRFRYILH